MLVRNIAPGVEALLPPEFVSRFLEEINYCDQSEAPPTKANQTHALLFAFHHTPPGHDHEHFYKGLLVYTPPRNSLQLGWFSGTGCLVAHPGQPPAVFQELDSVGAASPWVRIAMAMGYSASVDPATGFHRVWIVADFTFLGVTGLVLGAPQSVQRSFEADIHIEQSFGESPGPPFMEIVGTGAGGDQGRIYFTKTTVIP